MSRVCLLCLVLLSTPGLTADVPEASAEFRAQYIKENAPACIKGIEDKPDMRALYSHKTVEAYCTCRQRYKADVIANAIKDNKRGKAVADAAYEYAKTKCTPILLEQRETE
jgi:hypothetical protein